MTDVDPTALQDLGLTDLDSEVWLSRTRDGQLRQIRVDDMTDDHRGRLLQWIRANPAIVDRHQRRLIAHQRRAGDISLDEAARRIRELDQTDPAVWIEDTALVRRLVALNPRPSHPPRRRADRHLLPARLRYPLGGHRT